MQYEQIYKRDIEKVFFISYIQEFFLVNEDLVDKINHKYNNILK